MTRGQIPVYAIARAMKEQGATIDECVEQFNVPDFRPELMTLERLLEVKQYTPAANTGQRKEAFLRSVKKRQAASWPLPTGLRGAVAAVVVILAGTAVATAANPVTLVQDVGRAIGIVGESEATDSETFEIRAAVTRVDGDAGVIAVDEGSDGLEIHVDEEATLIGAPNLAAIRVGTVVEVEGTIDDSRYVASRIEVLERPDEGEEPAPEGTVESGPDPTAAPEGVAPPTTDPPGGIDAPSPGSDSPVVPGPEATPTPAPLLPIPVPTLPELPIDPPPLPDDPLPELPLPQLPLPGLPLPPLPPVLP